MHRFRPAIAAGAALGMLVTAACSPEVEAPPAGDPAVAAPRPAPVPAGAAVGYACEGGQTISVAYAADDTLRLTWRNQAYALRRAPSASGARYTGSGLEWWTATRDGQESATLGRLGPDGQTGAAILERCSRPAAAAPIPAAPVPGGPVVAPGQAVPPCRTLQIRPSEEGGDAGMGHRVAIIGLENIGPRPCSVSGYPTVTLSGADGKVLSSVRAEQRPGSFLRPGQAPSPVTLAPRAKAYFDLAWTVVPDESEGQTTCPDATRVRIMVPGETVPVVLPKDFAPCGGKIDVSPLRAVGQPTP